MERKGHTWCSARMRLPHADARPHARRLARLPTACCWCYPASGACQIALCPRHCDEVAEKCQGRATAGLLKGGRGKTRPAASSPALSVSFVHSDRTATSSQCSLSRPQTLLQLSHHALLRGVRPSLPSGRDARGRVSLLGAAGGVLDCVARCCDGGGWPPVGRVWAAAQPPRGRHRPPPSRPDIRGAYSPLHSSQDCAACLPQGARAQRPFPRLLFSSAGPKPTAWRTARLATSGA